LYLSPERLTIGQLSADAPIPAWAAGQASFCSITRTREELSIVCPENLVPAEVKQENGWRALKVDGPLDFALTGILASLAGPLARAGVSIFALSTYHTDYVLVKDAQLAAAVQALQAAGHTVKAD
jgi:hypothetical protein